MTRIYIQPKRGRLPRTYEYHGPRTSMQGKLRWIAFWLLVGAGCWGGIWWWLS